MFWSRWKQDSLKRPLMGKEAKYSKHIIVTSDNQDLNYDPDLIINDIVAGIFQILIMKLS